MNIFSGSGPSAAELQRQSAIKACITENLRLALKHLQREHIGTEGPIYSGDATNAVCNVLEAAFLHGLKSSASQKNFWGLLQKMTHRDTVFRLNRLGQITTEIGMCRAWLRLALNEGVLESYLDALLQDQQTLQYYYSRTAYLRDHEQAGILKTYIQSLMPFHFELSYNSSVLNIWTHTPLMLAGLIAGTSEPTPVLAATAASQNSAPKLNRSTGQGHAVEAKPKRPSKEKTMLSKVAPISGVQLPTTSPEGPPHLTQNAIDSMRQLRHRRGSGSSSTGTSQISCPDPVDARQLEPNLSQIKMYGHVGVDSMKNSDSVRRGSTEKFGDPHVMTKSKVQEIPVEPVRDLQRLTQIKPGHGGAKNQTDFSGASQAKIPKVSSSKYHPPKKKKVPTATLR